jgi:hypothetical protein
MSKPPGSTKKLLSQMADVLKTGVKNLANDAAFIGSELVDGAREVRDEVSSLLKSTKSANPSPTREQTTQPPTALEFVAVPVTDSVVTRESTTGDPAAEHKALVEEWGRCAAQLRTMPATAKPDKFMKTYDKNGGKLLNLRDETGDKILTDEQGDTLSHLAVRTGNADIIKWCIDKGFRIKSPNKDNDDPFGLSTLRQLPVELVRRLIPPTPWFCKSNNVYHSDDAESINYVRQLTRLCTYAVLDKNASLLQCCFTHFDLDNTDFAVYQKAMTMPESTLDPLMWLCKKPDYYDFLPTYLSCLGKTLRRDNPLHIAYCNYLTIPCAQAIMAKDISLLKACFTYFDIPKTPYAAIEKMTMPGPDVNPLIWLCERPDHFEILQQYCELLGPYLCEEFQNPLNRAHFHREILGHGYRFDFLEYYAGEYQFVLPFECAVFTGNSQATGLLLKLADEKRIPGIENESFRVFDKDITQERVTHLFTRLIHRKPNHVIGDVDWVMACLLIKRTPALVPAWVRTLELDNRYRKVFEFPQFKADDPTRALKLAIHRITFMYFLRSAGPKGYKEHHGEKGRVRAATFLNQLPELATVSDVWRATAHELRSDKQRQLRDTSFRTCLITGLLFGYTFHLMSALPNKDANMAIAGRLYLAETGEYVVRDPNGIVQKGMLPYDRTLSVANLPLKLNDRVFITRVLEITSTLGHTLFEMLPESDYPALDLADFPKPWDEKMLLVFATLMRMRAPVEQIPNHPFIVPFMKAMNQATLTYFTTHCKDPALKKDGFENAEKYWTELTKVADLPSTFKLLISFLKWGTSTGEQSYRMHVVRAITADPTLCKQLETYKPMITRKPLKQLRLQLEGYAEACAKQPAPAKISSQGLFSESASANPGSKAPSTNGFFSTLFK